MTTAESVLNALKPFELKSEGHNKYRANSPFRLGSNSHALTLRIEGDENGAWYDHVTEKGGSLYDLAEELGIEIPRKEAVETKRGYANLGEYAEAHGVTPDVLTAAGWGDRITHQDRPALPFKTATGTRYRFIDGEKPYYKSEQGYKSCWYGLRRAIDLARAHEQPLIICNGEISTVVAQHYNLAACAVTSGEKTIPNELLSELKGLWQGDIVIALDCDPKGRDTAQKIRMQLPAAKVADLGLTRGGDLADFCRLHQQDSIDALKNVIVPELDDAVIEVTEGRYDDLAAALRQVSAAIKSTERHEEPAISGLLDKTQMLVDKLRDKEQIEVLRSFSELSDANLQRLTERRKNPNPIQGLRSGISKLDYMLGGFVESRVHMVYADTNMGKSTLMVSVAKEFIKQAPGLVLSTESVPNAWLDKLAAAMCNIPYDNIETGQVNDEQFECLRYAYNSLKKANCDILEATSPTPQMLRHALRRRIEDYGCKWVIIDSISKMKVAGITDIYDTTRLVADELQDLAIENKVAILATCQVGRNLKDRVIKVPQINDALGAGTVEQNADVVMSLYNHSHYVSLGILDPDPKFPEDSALLRIIKHRWKPALNKAVMLKFVGGSGFYEMETERSTHDLVF